MKVEIIDRIIVIIITIVIIDISIALLLFLGGYLSFLILYIVGGTPWTGDPDSRKAATYTKEGI
jgi:hypothetical protein